MFGGGVVKDLFLVKGSFEKRHLMCILKHVVCQRNDQYVFQIFIFARMHIVLFWDFNTVRICFYCAILTNDIHHVYRFVRNV